METKWMAIMASIMFVAAFGSIALETYTEKQCVVAYAGSNKTAEEIAKVCSKGRL